MRHQIRPMLLLALVVVLLVALPASLAQSDTFGLSQADFSLLADANQLTAAVTSFEFNYSLDITITGTPQNSGHAAFTGEGALVAGDNAAFRITLNGSSDMDVQRQTFNGELRVVDGVIYDAYLNPATGEPIAWNSQTVDEFWELVSDLSGTPMDADTFATSLNPNQITFLINAMNPSDFLAVSREADESLDGRDIAHYVVNADFEAFFSSPFMSAMMSTQAGMPTTSQLMNAFEDSTFRIEEWIGLDDNMVHRLLFDLSLNVDPRPLGSFGDRVALGITFDITFSRFNETITISAPEGLEVVQQVQPTPVVPQVVVEGEAIRPNAPTAVQLGNQGTLDLVYTASGSETVSVIVRSVVAGGVDTTLEVIGPNGNTLAYNDDHNTTRGNLGNFDSAVENLELPGPGSYIIRVGSYNNSGGGNVEVLVESSAAPEVVVQPTVEPTIQAVQEEQVAILIPGALTADGGFTYPFTATRGQTVTIIVTDGSGPLDPHVTLLNPLFIGVAENDDHASSLPELDTQDSAIVDYMIPGDGTYYIVVTDNNGAAGPFELVLVRGGGLPDLADVRAGGDTTPVEAGLPTAVAPVEETTPVSVGEEVTLTLDGRTPTSYTFSGTAGQTITISAQAVNPPSPDMDVQVTVYDPGGAQLAYNDDHGGSDADLGQRDAQIAQLTLPATGDYRIEVDSWFDIGGELLLTVEEG